MTQGNLEIDKNIDETAEVKVQEEIVSDPNKLYNILGVMFETTKKRYSFEIIDDTQYKKGDKVIVDTIRGKEIGVVYGGPMKLEERVLVLPLKPVIKKASEEEIKKYELLREEAKIAYRTCKERIQYHKLPMKLIETEYTFDKTKLIFYFTAEGRIDFRDLVKDLANIFKLRIELRQIGVRDEARILGNIGICGKELCCRTFINKFDSVSIKMARDQGLVINPTKISGVCGRLLCCINYEYKQYEEALRVYPAVNQIVKTQKGDGKVMSISPLNGFLYIDIESKGIMKVTIDEIKFNKKEAKKLQNVLSTEELQHKVLEKE
ncbi:MAG: stage 0 sporulation family protein [Cetobacterium sp.]|uniref:PSP1 domain-containing protein n=1 Tax=Cetobacterium sp. TaxID=2071632 RepID=UPI002FCB371A